MEQQISIYSVISVFPVAVAPFIGSFLATLIVRIPRGEPVAFDRSRCRACDRRLAVPDLVPLLSWLWNKGQCRFCGETISIYYPVMEIAALAVAIWAAWLLEGWDVWIACMLGFLLLPLALIDFREFILPDKLTGALIATGLTVGYLRSPEGIMPFLIGAVVGYAMFRGISYFYRRLRRRDGLGLGDAKLLAGAGAWVSWVGLPTVLLYGSIAGLAYVALSAMAGKRVNSETRVPFGTFLCLGIWMTWLYGPLVVP